MMEDTGYMARIAFMMDRLMSRVGLNGKSFLPLLSSHACAVPGVMATRTIDNPKDRLITILVSPLAGCSARLPVYLLMIATMIPSDEVPAMTKALFLLSMYALGVGGAFFFAWLFHKQLLKGEGAPMILELPSYKSPALTAVLWQMWERTRIFIRRAGTVILGISILLWFAVTYPKSDNPDPSVAMEQSIAGTVGKIIEPVIQPMGYDWKIGIGLIASFAAREVFVSTMSIIYSVEETEEIEPLRDRLRAEKRPDGRPVYTPRTCLSLMVFYVFAMQCLSTVAVVKRETNGWKWPLFQIAYMTLTACLGAFLVYQIGGMMGQL
jgi:ferrous iron transport protein B